MESSSKGAEDGCTRVKFSRLNLVDLAGVTACTLPAMLMLDGVVDLASILI